DRCLETTHLGGEAEDSGDLAHPPDEIRAPKARRGCRELRGGAHATGGSRWRSASSSCVSSRPSRNASGVSTVKPAPVSVGSASMRTDELLVEDGSSSATAAGARRNTTGIPW